MLVQPSNVAPPFDGEEEYFPINAATLPPSEVRKRASAAVPQMKTKARDVRLAPGADKLMCARGAADMLSARKKIARRVYVVLLAKMLPSLPI